MKPSIAPEHREFFIKNQLITFENLFSETQIAALQKKLEMRSLEQEARQPRLLPPDFHEIASNLFKKRPLRIGADRYFPLERNRVLPFKKEKLTLKEIVSLTFLAGGALINLSTHSTLFFSADLPLEFSALLEQEYSYYLIAYALERSCYAPQANDPDPYLLKREGYVLGERLSQRTHPFVIR